MAFKQVILVRMDLKLSKGKMAVQVAHAAVDCALKSSNNNVKQWKEDNVKKVTLKIADKSELLKFKNYADEAGLTNALISDAGRTELPPGTMTCLGIGPDDEEKIDAVTGHLTMI